MPSLGSNGMRVSGKWADPCTRPPNRPSAFGTRFRVRRNAFSEGEEQFVVGGRLAVVVGVHEDPPWSRIVTFQACPSLVAYFMRW